MWVNETSISDVDLFVEDDRHLKFESAYIILEQRMNKAGYITDKDGNTKYTFDAKIMINLQLDKKNIKNK
jgi:hypothetical protein